MAFTVSADFKSAADDPQRRPAKEFSFPDGQDRTAKVLDMGRFSQQQYEGDALTSPNLTVGLLNDSKEFNFLKTDKTNIGKTGKIRIGFYGTPASRAFGAGFFGAGAFADYEFIDRFIGYLDEVRFESTDRPRCQMVFGGRVQRALERKIGSDAAPVSYYAAAWNPADLAWDILTVHGGLDTTTSTANVDIDYTSFLAYQAICNDLTFSLRGNFTGQTVAEAMRLIGEVTDAIIFGETDGKIYMKKFVPEEAATPYLFTDANAHLDPAELFLNKDRLLNQSKVWWGYSVALGDWSSGGSVTDDNSSSQTDFGVFLKEFDNTNVWHDTSASAGAFGERFVDRYAEPPETIRFSSGLGSQALIHQMGDNIEVTWDQMDYVQKPMRIYGMGGDLMSNEYEILAEDLAPLNAEFFILNSTQNGVLDVNVLF